MNDSQAIAKLIAVIESGLTLLNVTAIVQADYQVTQQGTPTASFISLHNIANRRYGHPKNKTVYNEIDNKLEQTEGVIVERTYQVSAYTLEEPDDMDTPNAYDLCATTAQILQLERTQRLLKNDGISILRIADIREGYFTDDKDRNEKNPTFDFIICYDDMVTTEADALQSIEQNVYSV